MDRNTGDVTGEAVLALDEEDRERARDRGVPGSSGTGGRRSAADGCGSWPNKTGSDDALLRGLLLLVGRMSTRAPALRRLRRTSLLPLATATWMGNRPLKSGVSMAILAL